ncbi:MAG: hypothetical protein Q9P01_19690 [Anaerolineae bacterium]|nr:hypothetical protein [Anaerolineae bacterium]
MNYAFLRNRPIVPIVIRGRCIFDNPQTAKNDLRFMAMWIPDELKQRNAQFLLYEGGICPTVGNCHQKFQSAAHRWQDKESKRPVDPQRQR